MITLYRPLHSRTAEELEDKLEELALARRIVVVNGQSAEEAGVPAGTSLPAIEEGGRFYGGEEEALAYVEDLEREVRQGRQFQSDACYLDPDHPDRCL
ncbi:MAG TPA: hypothetical protein VFG50_13595 [Rhodothermales bacterium]|nr:hypothetical protein [Rhodothermales bacterium]